MYGYLKSKVQVSRLCKRGYLYYHKLYRLPVILGFLEFGRLKVTGYLRSPLDLYMKLVVARSNLNGEEEEEGENLILI